MTKHSTARPTQIVNRRASYDYQLGDKLVVGLVLSGPEVRSLRDNRASLKGAFVTIRQGELWLNNASLTLKYPRRWHRRIDHRSSGICRRYQLANQPQPAAVRA